MWLNDYAENPTDATLENYFSICSSGRAKFQLSRNAVVGVIDVPCSGTLSDGTPFESEGRCGGPEIFGWAEFADNYTTNVRRLSCSVGGFWGGGGEHGCLRRWGSGGVAWCQQTGRGLGWMWRAGCHSSCYWLSVAR